MKNTVGLFKETFAEFTKDKATRLAAALAYYTIFSLAPLLIIAIAVSALVLGQKGATEQISYQLRDLVGGAGAATIQSMIESANQPRSGIIAAIVGVATLLFGASGVFGQLQDALNTVWHAEPTASNGVLGFIRDRFLSFAMVFGTGFILLVSLVLSAGIAAMSKIFAGMVPGIVVASEAANFVLSLILVAALFAMIFKILPNTPIGWRDVWRGAFVTSLLFTMGKFALGFYLGRGAIASSYGVAGSLIVILLWVYYSSMILLFGAEFTKVYSRHHGTRCDEAKGSKKAAPPCPQAVLR